MNILITGSTGFIGRHLTNRLLELKKDKVFCLVRNLTKAKPLEDKGANLIYGDISEKASLKSILDNEIDIIFHCAAYVGDDNPELLEKTNVVGTENICELACKLKIKRMVYLSSVAVISANEDVPLTENLPYASKTHYGKSKIEAEKIVLSYRDKGLPVAILRPPIVYGEDEPHGFKFLLFLIRHRLLPLLNKGKNKFHLVYVENVVEAMIFALTENQMLEGTYFIADKEILTSKEVFTIMSQAQKVKPPFILPTWLEKILLFLPFFGRKARFFLKDKVFSTQRIESIGFNCPYQAQESIFKSIANFKK